MPSPFPGMDPYVESSGRWPDFHASVLTYARDLLNDRLPGRYVASIEVRFRFLEVPGAGGRLVRPDVAVVGVRPALGGDPLSGGPAVATLEPVTRTLPMAFEEARETRLEVRGADDGRLVTVIELLSPSNKAAPGYFEYDARRQAPFHQRLNLVEIDLLLSGRRLPTAEPLPPADYFALVARGRELPRCSVYSWTVRTPLPTVPIPLLGPDPDVPLELQALVATAYDRGRYARTIDYGAQPTLPLDSEARAWVEQQARAARTTANP